MAATDTELLALSRAQDSQAFGRLIDRYKDRVVNYLSRLTGCRDRAEDIAQETFVRFYRQLHRYRDEGSLAAYLFRIATNLVRSEERRKRRWQALRPLLAVSGYGSNGSHSPASPQATSTVCA